MNKVTPMMQQYLEIKARYPGFLLLYRMGDFYEMFMDDAVEASQILEIALTSRDRNAENPLPMCGVPFHAAENYITRLVAAGRKIAICDQVEDPRQARGLVRRAVTRVITPGMILESGNLSAKQPNYLAAISSDSRSGLLGLAYVDVSTAEFRVVELDGEEALGEELLRVSPREILLSAEDETPCASLLERESITVTRIPDEDLDRSRAEERLCRQFEVHSLDGFGVAGMDHGIRAAGAILSYLQANLLETSRHLNKMVPYSRSDFMILDEATARNLEIFQSTSFQGRKGSLLEVLDRTKTPMGARMLQQWLRFPLLDLTRINMRQHAVSELVDQSALRASIMETLSGIGDIERLNARNCTGVSGPRDLVSMKRSLQRLPAIEESLQSLVSPLILEIKGAWNSLEDVAELIGKTLNDPPPLNFNSGGVIAGGISEELDRYVRLSTDARGWIADFEAAERMRTGITSLKVRYNKVFGYYIEISRSNLEAVPADYSRKQTLVNAERYVTEELKEFETQVLEADEKRLELEQQIFSELRRRVALESERIREVAVLVATLDCLSALAEAASMYDYCRPQLGTGDAIRISEGRHPVIEHFTSGGRFVPNDLELDMETRQLLIITGPNMSGKSTILRQAALIVLMAHIGSFVPAASADIGLVDRIFTRVGASDDLARGRSTFMVEMHEAANILHQATPRSLIILDEIGRGTSTFDGLSIAWAIAEYLHDMDGAGVKTLFATHYHELTDLARTCPRVKNCSVSVKEWQNDIIFFHKLVPGSSNRSYGIQVARLAGLPRKVTDRARSILASLEGGSHDLSGKNLPVPKKSRKQPEQGMQLSLFTPPLNWVRDRIMSIDLDNLSPMGALQMLYALKQQLESGRSSGMEVPGDPTSSAVVEE